MDMFKEYGITKEEFLDTLKTVGFMAEKESSEEFKERFETVYIIVKKLIRDFEK